MKRRDALQLVFALDLFLFTVMLLVGCAMGCGGALKHHPSHGPIVNFPRQ